MPENSISCESRRTRHRLKLKPAPPPIPADLFPDRRFRNRKGATPAQIAEARRKLIELIVSRAELLPDADAALVLAVYRDGVVLPRLVAAARTSAAPDPDPHHANLAYLRRRLHRLARRCIDPLFVFVSINSPALPPTMRRVATACILHGMSLRRAALTLNLSHHVVRLQRERLQALFESSQSADKSAPATPFVPPQHTLIGDLVASGAGVVGGGIR